MAVMTGGRVRTAPGTAVLAALILVLAFGNPAYVSWANHNTNATSAWGFFLRTLAWPTWSFNSKESVQTLLANDVKAILLIVLTGVMVAMVGGSRLFMAGWGGYIFAAAVAAFLAAFIQTNASLLGAFTWAAGGAVYGLFVGWIVGLATLGSAR